MMAVSSSPCEVLTNHIMMSSPIEDAHRKVDNISCIH